MQISGSLVAILTPFTADDRLDEDALARHAAWMASQGIGGIVVCGTTGESATLTEDEKVRAMAIVREAVGRDTRVVGGVGNNSTAESLAFLDRVNREVDVDAIMSVVPYYNKPSQAGILAHFQAIATASKFPVIAYNVPGRTVVGMSAETLIAASHLPNVVAIKEASADLFLDTFVLEGRKPGVAVLSGDDATAFPLIALGGDGVISVVGNVAPALVAQMCAAARASDWATARAKHHQIVHVHRLMFCESSPVPAKIVAEALGFGTAAVRLPLVLVDKARRDWILQQASDLGVLA